MPGQEPRGSVAEQVREIDSLLGGESDGTREGQPADDEPQMMPDEDSSGESLEEEEIDTGEDEAPEGEDEGAEGPGEIQTLGDYIKASGWDAPDFYALKMRLDNGEEITVGELKDKAQEGERSRAEIQTARQQLEQQQQALHERERQMLLGHQQTSEEVRRAQDAVAMIQAQYDSIDWEGLKAKDPGRYAALRSDFGVEYANAQNSLAQAQQVQTQQVQQRLNEERAMHNQLFLEMVPEARDPKVAQQLEAQAQAYAMNYWGFSEQEVQGIYDARARAVLLDSMKWRQHLAEVEKAKGKVRAAPKPVMRPGGRGVVQPARNRQVDALTAKAKQSGKVADQVAAIDALLKPQR